MIYMDQNFHLTAQACESLPISTRALGDTDEMAP